MAKDRREERGNTGGLVAAALRYDSRLSYRLPSRLAFHLVLLSPPPFPSPCAPHLPRWVYESLQPSVVFRLSPPTLARPDNLLSRRREHLETVLAHRHNARAQHRLVRVSFSLFFAFDTPWFVSLSLPRPFCFLSLSFPRSVSVLVLVCIKPRPHGGDTG